MAKESTYAPPITPVLTDWARVVDDPGGTPATGNATLQSLLTLFQANIAVPNAQVTGLGALALLSTVGSAQITDGSVALGDMANLSQATVVGRASGAGTGAPTALSGAQLATILGLGTLASLSSVATANIDNDAVDNTKLANMAEATFKMRAAGAGTGDPIDGTITQAKTALAIADTDVANAANGTIPSGTTRSQITVLEARTNALARLTAMKDGIVGPLVEYFVGGIGSAAVGAGQFGWIQVVSGGTVAGQTLAGDNLGGNIILTATTSPTDRTLYRSSQVLVSGVGFPWQLSFRAQVPTIDNGTQDATWRLGMYDGTNAADPTDGCWFQHDGTTGNWRLATGDGGSVNYLSSGVAVDTGNHWFDIICDGAGNVAFYIDDAQCSNSPISGANLPDAGVDFYGPQFGGIKTAGSGALTCLVRRVFFYADN